MSEKCIVDTEWEFLKDSIVVPFLDAENSYNGCTLIMAHNEGVVSQINLCDTQNKNNLLNYQTEVLMIGSKRFELDFGNADNYLLVVSCKMRMDLFDLFDSSETMSMLKKGVTQTL